MCACHIVIDVFEIILFAVKRLQPLLYLLLQILKTTVWLALTLTSMLNAWSQVVTVNDDQPSTGLIPTFLQPVGPVYASHLPASSHWLGVEESANSDTIELFPSRP